jgi:tetratricopeptide (TPR) repeat protein/glutathione synthase/RimK-type ligase-like ATP-grasp enzyme
MPSAQPLHPPARAAQDHSATLQTALDLHQAGERDAAERLYLQVLEADPREPTALYLYGVFNHEAGRLDVAGQLLGEVVELRPDVAEAHMALALLSARCGRRREAIAGYRKVLELQPGHPPALLNLMSIIIEGGFVDEADFEGAMDVCRAAVALLPDPAPAHAVLGRILLASGRTAEAIESYRAAVGLTPSNVEALGGLALALLAAEDAEAALAAADAALALKPDFADAWLRRGSALLLLHRPEAAAQALEHGAALAPSDSRMHLGLGDAYAELDRHQEAVTQLALAAALDPASKWAQANLGAVLYGCGDLQGAERHCRAALAIDPQMPSAHRSLAGVLAERGEAAEARRHRDAAYAETSVQVVRAPQAEARVLVLTTADSGNVPHRHLLPKQRYTRIDWFIEYAREGQAAELPPYDVVFNIIGDPDYAAAAAAPMAAFLKTCARPLLNDPARVAATRRDRLPALLGDIAGVAVPKVLRFDPAAHGPDLAAQVAAAGLEAPLIVRPIGSHGGRGVTLARTDPELAQVDARDCLYLTEYVDSASPADGRYRKYRMIFVDRAAYPYHLAIKEDWLVHYYTAEMTGDRARQAEELRFLEDPAAALGEAAMAAVAAIGRRLDLDYAGLDFSLTPDGRVLVFEANATMLVHPEPPGEFAYKNPYVDRITAAFQDQVARRAR